MSKHETQMTRWYWEQRGGTLVEEFCAVRRRRDRSAEVRLLDGVIILNEPHRLARTREVSLEGKDVVVVQTKNRRLGMYLMGQVLFSAELIRAFKPRSVESIALCSLDDAVLRPLLEAHKDCHVVVCPPEVCGISRMGAATGRPQPRLKLVKG
jgi:hypothetical protein